MDVKEKLVELLGNIYLPMMDGHNTIGEYNIPHKFKEKIADYLISNGVTVQEWISVKDRLPEPYVPVLVQMPGEKPFQTVREGFLTWTGIWHNALFDRRTDEGTKCMPFPESPSEE